MFRSTGLKPFAIAGALCLFALPTQDVAMSATLGDPKAGKAFAQSECASCHAVEADKLNSPVAEATPFQIIADTPGMTRTALAVFLRTPHPTMPNLIVDGDDTD